jgi:hypothetical protein
MIVKGSVTVCGMLKDVKRSVEVSFSDDHSVISVGVSPSLFADQLTTGR